MGYKTSKFLLTTLIFVVMVTFLGCEKISFLGGSAARPVSAKPPANTVAKVGSFFVTLDDLNKEIENYNALVTAQGGLPQDKIDARDKKIVYLRNEMVRKYILYQEALDRGLDRKEAITKALENTKINLLVTELVREELEKVDVPSKEIEDFYNQNKERLKEPEQRKIWEIMTKTEDEAKQVYIELLKGGDFAALAKQYSKAATAANGGDLGFIALEFDPQKRIRFDKFYEIAFSPSLEAGNISSIFKGTEGYYILKLESIKETQAKLLSELWDNIKNWLLFEKQQKAIAELASRLTGETKIEIYEGEVK